MPDGALYAPVDRSANIGAQARLSCSNEDTRLPQVAAVASQTAVFCPPISVPQRRA
jgi:hypothetical protein